MNTIKYILLVFITLFFIDGAVSQNTCELGHLIPVKKAVDELNDTLPVLTPPPPYQTLDHHVGSRMLYFVHGMNGNHESWENAASAVKFGIPAENFPSRDVYIDVPNYNSSQDKLINAVEFLLRPGKLPIDSDQLPSDYLPYKGIAIAHSQGGIVCRALDEYYSRRNTAGELINANERKFGGLVTVATPNQGAQIVNNEDFILGLVNDLGDNLTAGPYREFRNSPSFFVELMASLVNLDEIRDSLVSFIGNDFGSFLLKESMPNITNAYTVPGLSGKGLTSKIPMLNSYDPSVLKEDNNERPTDLVAFYAVADLIKTYNNVRLDKIVGFQGGAYVSQPNRQTMYIDEIIVPISWATIHFQLNSPNTGIDHFKADNEDFLTAYRAHKTKNFYDSKVFENEQKRAKYRAKEKNAGWGVNPLYFYYRYQRSKAQKRKDSWERGSVMLSKFDELYRIMIGSRYSEWEILTIPLLIDFCDCEDLVNGNLIPMDCVLIIENHDVNTLDCNDYPDPPEVIEYPILTWRNKDSDGVVLAESAMDIPQHTKAPRKLESVSHMQVRNSSHTAEMLQTVFEGGVGDFFITDPKDE